MYLARALRLSAAGMAAVVALGTLGATAAEAKPSPAPTGLKATVTAHQDGSFDVATSWDAVPSATSYRVTLTQGATTLSSAQVATTSWPTTVSTTPGNASLNVRAVLGKKPGRAATISVPLPDAVAPQGSYASAWDDDTGLATITQVSLTDNLPTSGVTRVVDWGDPAHPGTVTWPTGTTLQHTYPLTEQRYTPTVKLEDAAHNVTVVDVPAVVIDDKTAPTGAFSATPATAWSAFTTVTVTQEGDLSDNWTPADLIARSVDWGDGSTEAWTTGTTLSHVYAAPGNYTPVVTITDEAHNANPLSTSAVLVTADTVAPAVKLTLPKPKNSVRAWKTLRGTAVDAETGLKSVWLKAVEKRGAAWYGYNATTHAWAKAATKTKAFTKAKAFSLTTDVANQWAAKLVKLRKGTLVYKLRYTDQVNNRSATVTHTARLTRR